QLAVKNLFWVKGEWSRVNVQLTMDNKQRTMNNVMSSGHPERSRRGSRDMQGNASSVLRRFLNRRKAPHVEMTTHPIFWAKQRNFFWCRVKEQWTNNG
ncbi:hypothetical protein, partial [Flagellimonas beolgyonensis]|uniref:hypothetical protein n=1 Tax=Flagellimonas beolgyonensis TaxID=864064 RepID=UPI0019D02A80